MPYPVGMQTRLVSFAPFLGTDGVPTTGNVVRITSARSFIWGATGEVFLAEPITVRVGATPVTQELPVPDQPGFIDGAGNTISGWTYTATYHLSSGLYVEPVTFLLPEAVETLAIVPDVSTLVDGGIVNVPTPVAGTPGASAYEIAVANGFVGDEAAWLESLQGADGAGATDATTVAKGVIQLAGDLGGTAAAPTVPGLASKANTAHTHPQSDITNLTTDLAGKAATVHTHPQSDITNLTTDLAAKAPLASPVFTGNPTAPTPSTADNDTSIATTAFVKAQAYAPLASPALTGNPTAPTPTTGDNDTSIATTAFVKAQAYAPLASPALTGTPTAPTPSAGDNDTSIATTAFVTDAIVTAGRYVVNAQTGTTYTPVLSDENKLVTLTNAAAITVTLPQDSALAMPVGATITFAVRGAGMATFAAGSGATVEATPTAVTRATSSWVQATKVAANTWMVVGDLAG